MTLAVQPPETPTAPVSPSFAFRENVRVVGYWITLGAAAGGLGGAVVGGVFGRLAMFILRLTSHDSVRGVESDDGFTIGRFNVFDTSQLLLTTAVMGGLVGLIVVAGRPFFPKRGMPLAWALAGAITGGAILISKDGVDFTLLGPKSLAVAFFIAIPCLGAGVIAWLTELYPRFWWRRRRLTALAALAVLPSIVFFPIAIFALLFGASWALAMSFAPMRAFPGWMPARMAAIVVFSGIVALGLLDLSADMRAIL